MSAGKMINVQDYRRHAKARLPAPIFHYLEGGADDEWSMRNNISAFDGYQILPRTLIDISRVDMSTSVLGQDISMPLICSPTGMSRLFHHEKEIAVARVAADFGILYSLSTMSTTSIEDIAASSTGPKMFQMYIFKDRELTKELLQRARHAGYGALCLTVDTPIAGNRERDRRTGMTMPPRFSLKSLSSFIAHPRWSFAYLQDSNFTLANVESRIGTIGKGSIGVIEYVNRQFDSSVSWDDAAWLASEWNGPFAIKGIQAPADALRASQIGATAVMISNHGGRQMDGTPAPIDCVRPMREAVGDTIEIIVDGGVRRGSHVLKAIALGANACSIGRPYLYGLAACGEAGVRGIFGIFRDEIERGMRLMGCTTLKHVGPEHVRVPFEHGKRICN